MKTTGQAVRVLLTVLYLIAVAGAYAHAAPINAPITGEIEWITVNDPADVYSGGTMVVGGQNVILPRNLLIDLPANRLSLQQLFDQAPAACKAVGESGLAKTDSCNGSGTGGIATLSAVRTNAGNIIAGDVFIQKGAELVIGQVTHIDYTDGYFRVNGVPGDPATGVMVRLNDPTGRHTVQQGLGCRAGHPNCSADPRFGLDPDNYVIAFSTGYPVCIPSTISRAFVDVLGLGTTTAQGTVSGAGDILCPDSNRTNAAVEPPVADSRRFAPLLVGDSVTAEGNFETIGGVHFLSTHTMQVGKALTTRNDPTQPDYLFLDEAFIDAPGFQNQRARALIIGFTTLSPTDVDFWTIHRDPAANAIHQFPLASVQGCDAAAGLGTCSNQGPGAGPGGANIFKINYDVDFVLAALGNPPGGARVDLSPCDQLRNSPRFKVSNPGLCPGGATFANNFGILSPIPHELQARTGHSLDHPGLVTLDVNGRQATNGQYLFPLGINLGGIEIPFFAEINLNQINTPTIFEGVPWNLDRRLSPGGCMNAGGCEAGPQPLDPFPFTGLDPRVQADFPTAGVVGGTPKGSYNDPNCTQSVLSSASDRIFSFVSGNPNNGRFNFDGDNTLLACARGSCPADPPLITINPTPVPNLFAPVAVDDAAVTSQGAAVTIKVLANDIPVAGTIDQATVAIVSSTPANGRFTLNFPSPGDVTYTPAAGFTGTNTFTYTVANNFGAVSNAAAVTVTVTTTAVDTFTVAISAGAGGAVTGPSTANRGDMPTYTIAPHTGFHVADVKVDGVSKGAVKSLMLPPLTGNATVAASFAVNTYTVTRTAVNGGIAGPATVIHGDAPTYAVTPAVGYHLVDVKVDGVSQGAVATLNLPPVTSDQAVTAFFTINIYTITTENDARGAVSPSGKVTVTHGANETFIFTPSAGYNVVNIIIDGVPQGPVSSYTFTNVTGDNHTVKVVCIPDGDVNNDGKVDVADALRALRISVGLETADATSILHGDVAPLGADGVPLPDKKISAADALVLLKKIIGLINY